MFFHETMIAGDLWVAYAHGVSLDQCPQVVDGLVATLATPPMRDFRWPMLDFGLRSTIIKNPKSKIDWFWRRGQPVRWHGCGRSLGRTAAHPVVATTGVPLRGHTLIRTLSEPFWARTDCKAHHCTPTLSRAGLVRTYTFV